MSEAQRKRDNWWMNGGTLYESKWASQPAARSIFKDESALKNVVPRDDAITISNRFDDDAFPNTSDTDPSLKGLDGSRWANPMLKAYPTPKGLGRRAPPFPVDKYDNKQRLTLDTSIPAGDPLRLDDARDIIMGENTPVDIQSPVYASAVSRDEDGDIVMQDLDDTGIMSKIVEVVGVERRVGGFSAQSSDTIVGLPSRVKAVEWVLVVDTSFILTHLHLVNNLVEAYHRWGNVVMLPWATIMELDGLKKSTSSVRCTALSGAEETVTVGMLARRANNWAFEKMAKKEKGLWGQTKEESMDPNATKGDAAILDCCRYIKERKGIETALLSNDRNLCVQALVYNIKAISYVGTPFTADSIMSVLEGEKEGSSYCPPGIWSSLEEAEKPRVMFANPPSYNRAPVADNGKTGIFGFHHTGSEIHPRRNTYFGNDMVTRTNIAETMTTPENILGNSNSDEGSQGILRILLLKIEIDLETYISELLHQYWITIPAVERARIREPRNAKSLDGIEASLVECLESRLDVVLPGEDDIIFKIKTGFLSSHWKAWGHWASPKSDQSVPAVKPNFKELKMFIRCWELIWEGLLKTLNPGSKAVWQHNVCLGVWSSLANSLARKLPGGN